MNEVSPTVSARFQQVQDFFCWGDSAVTDKKGVSSAISSLQPDQIQGFLSLEGRVKEISAKELFRCHSSIIYQLFVLYPQKIKGLLLPQQHQLDKVLLKVVLEKHDLLFGVLIEILKEEGNEIENLCDLNPIFSKTFEKNQMAILKIMQKTVSEEVWNSMVEKYFLWAVKHHYVQLIKFVLDAMPVDKRTTFLLSKSFIVFSIGGYERDEDRILQTIDVMLNALTSDEEKHTFILKTEKGWSAALLASKFEYVRTIRILTQVLPEDLREQFLMYPYSKGVRNRATALFHAKNAAVVRALLDPLPETTRTPFIAFEYSYWERYSYTTGYPAYGTLYSTRTRTRSALICAKNREVDAAIRRYLSDDHPLKRPFCQIL